MAMLVGTTFAWFTDSVTSSVNIIKSGSLEVGMYWAEGDEDPNTVTWKDASTTAIFNNDNWEPNYIESKHIKIVNEGTLALKYRIDIEPNGEVQDLADVIDVYFIDGATQLTRDIVNASTPICTLREFINKTDGFAYGYLLAEDNSTAELESVRTFTIVFKMRYQAGNEYQKKSIGSDFAIRLVATQFASEEDSFDANYDIDAVYPAVANTVVKDTTVENKLAVATSTGTEVSVAVPANVAEEGSVYSLTVSNEFVTNDTENYTKTVSYDITLLKNGNKLEETAGVSYKVQIKGEPDANVVEVKHNGAIVPSFDYDATTGIIEFETSSFSPFEVVYSVIPSDAVAFTTSATGKKVYFTSFADAVDSIAADCTLTLMNNVEVDSTLTFDADAKVVFDLANFAITGKVGTLIKATKGEIEIKNGTIKNEHEGATQTKYGIVLSGNAVAKITNVNITTSGVGIYVADDAKITELNANVDSYIDANGYVSYDAIMLLDNAKIDLISGGEYTSKYSDKFISDWYNSNPKQYSANASWALNVNGEGAVIGEIKGGTFLGTYDKGNNGAAINVNNGTIKLISGGYFGFAKTGLDNPYWTPVGIYNGGAIESITGGTFEKGTSSAGFRQNVIDVVTNGGYKFEETGETVAVNIQFSTKVTTYNVKVVNVVKA